jgi:hypothetical protein
MGNIMNKRLVSMLLILLVTFSGCNVIRPFFIKNKKKEIRKEKRTEKKIERKESKVEKKQDKIDDLKSNLSKIDSMPVIRKDSLVIRPLDTGYALSMIGARKIGYETYQCRAKMHFESDKEKQNFSINFRIKKDSIIWAIISAPIIGEIARAVVTPDSIKAIERINKKYYLYSYNDIQKLINIQVDFKTLQDLIVGNAIALAGNFTEIKELGPISNIIIKGKDYTNQLTYTRGDSTLKQLQLQTSRPASSSSLLIALSQYGWVDNRMFASQRQYNILDIKGAIELDMEINKAEFDKAVDYPFSIPKNFKLQE